jgi:chromate reductase, NAD(P)H dehydrogenase (quinone)
MTEVERTEGRRERLRVLVFSASLRKKSLNTRLARLVVASIQGHDGTVDFADMREFDCPSYDGDLEAAEGLPAGAQAFRTRLEAANAFVIVSPEYNGSMPGVLKNAIDWVSRARPQPFNERHGLLLSASPSMVGGNRGLWALRRSHLPEHVLAGPGPPGLRRRRTRRCATPCSFRGHDRELPRPGRGLDPLPVHQAGVGRVPR